MKLKVYGGGGSFCVKLNDSDDHVLVLSKGLTAYEAAHELATWLEDVSEAIVFRGPVEAAPVTEPVPPQAEALAEDIHDANFHAAVNGVPETEPVEPPQAESLEHGSPGTKFGSPGVTDWTDQGRPDFTKPAAAPVTVIDGTPVAELKPFPELAPVPADVAPAPTEAAPEPPKEAS